MNRDALTFGPLPGLGKPDRWLLVLSIVAGALYLVTPHSAQFPVHVVVKALSIAPLAVLAFRVLHGGDRLLLGAALAFSSLGDVLLDLPGNHFVQGLLAFLVAHVLYIALFVGNWRRPRMPGRAQVAMAAAVIMYSVLLFMWLAPGLGELVLPVTIYTGALTLMAVTSIMARFATPIVPFGAILFVISDSMIAAGRFRTALPLAGVLIWVTYYVGQYCIAVGYLREKTRNG